VNFIVYKYAFVEKTIYILNAECKRAIIEEHFRCKGPELELLSKSPLADCPVNRKLCSLNML
jgi:hypothetical protein